MDKVIEQTMKEVRFSKWNTKTERVRQPLTIEELKKALMHYKPTEIWHSSYSDKVPFITAGGYNEKGFIMSFHSAADKMPEYKTYEQFHKYMRAQGLDCLYIKVPNDTKTIELSPTTTATSWEEVEKAAREEWMLKHAGEAVVKYDCNFNNYFVEYLSRHWPVSPTPVSETWEEVLRNADSYAEGKSQNHITLLQFEKIYFFKKYFIEYLTQYAHPSLHQVDRWVRVEDGLPEVIKKSKAVWGYSPKLKQIKCWYFPDKFKTIEWEDWDDYSQEMFPWTTEDADKGCVWLNAGWYYEVEDNDGNLYWNPIYDLTHWQPLPAAPETDKNI